MKSFLVIAALVCSACTVDSDAPTTSDEQALGGLTVTVGCDSGGNSLLCTAAVSGGAAPYAYTWHAGADVTGPLSEFPKAPQTAHAACGPVNRAAGVWVSVTDATGANASGSGSTACELEW